MILDRIFYAIFLLKKFLLYCFIVCYSSLSAQAIDIYPRVRGLTKTHGFEEVESLLPYRSLLNSYKFIP